MSRFELTAQDVSILATFVIDASLFLAAFILWIIVRRLRGDRLSPQNFTSDFTIVHDLAYHPSIEADQSSISSEQDVQANPFDDIIPEGEPGGAEISLQMKDSYSDLPKAEKKKMPTPLGAQSLWHCLKLMWSVKLSDFDSVDIANYFLVHKKFATMFLFMSLVGICISIPANLHFGRLAVKASQSAMGHDGILEDAKARTQASVIYQISSSSWTSNPTMESLWTFSVAALIQALIALYFGRAIISHVNSTLKFNTLEQIRTTEWAEWTATNDIKNFAMIESNMIAPRRDSKDTDQSSNVMFFTVAVDGLQSQIVQDIAIRGVFESIYPDSVLGTHLILDYSTVLKEKEKYEKAEEHLHRVRADVFGEIDRIRNDSSQVFHSRSALDPPSAVAGFDRSPLLTPSPNRSVVDPLDSRHTYLESPQRTRRDTLQSIHNGSRSPISSPFRMTPTLSRATNKSRRGSLYGLKRSPSGSGAQASVPGLGMISDESSNMSTSIRGNTLEKDPILAIVNGMGGGLGRSKTLPLSRFNCFPPTSGNVGHTFARMDTMWNVPTQYEPSLQYQTETRKKLEMAEGRLDDARSALLRAIRSRPSRNTRKAFVVFKCTRAVQRALAFQHRQFFHDWGWRLSLAPPPQDILWRHIHVTKRNRFYRQFIGLVILVLIDFVLTTSALFSDWILPLSIRLEAMIDERTRSFFKLTVVGFVTPAIFFVINSWMMPTCIWFVAQHTRHWKWSAMQKQVLYLNAILLFFNTTILPIFGAYSIYAFLDKVLVSIQESSSGVYDFGISLARSVFAQTGSFGIRYLISATFLSSASQLLQIPKIGVMGLFVSLGKNPPVWRFDFGYWYSYTLSIVFVGIMFCSSTPLVLPLAGCACMIKYAVDKYNFSTGFWYVSNDSKGTIALEATRFLFWVVAFYLAMTSFYSMSMVYELNHSILETVGGLPKLDGAPKAMETVGTALRGTTETSSVPTLMNSLRYHLRELKLISKRVWTFSCVVLIIPLGAFNAFQLIISIYVVWKYVFKLPNVFYATKRFLVHQYFSVRRLARGMDIQYYRHSVAHDLSAMKYEFMEENIVLSDLMNPADAVAEYEPPVEREIEEFMEREKGLPNGITTECD